MTPDELSNIVSKILIEYQTKNTAANMMINMPSYSSAGEAMFNQMLIELISKLMGVQNGTITGY